MAPPDSYTMSRFLDSKRTIDDRALNKDVFQRLKHELEAGGKTLEILEVGAGLGTMIARLVEWGVLKSARYTLLDLDGTLLSDSRNWLAEWAREQGLSASEEEGRLGIAGGSVDLHVSFVEADIRDYLGEPHAVKADLLIANAFLDLVDLDSILPSLLGLVRSGGLCWFTINFDGETIFQPPHKSDPALLSVYHRSMDERTSGEHRAGHSRTGRLLFSALPEAGVRLLSAGASDWVVFPEGDVYPHKESYFLHHILNTIDLELRRHSDVDRQELKTWIAERQGQVEQGRLVYIAHQLDLLGRVS